MKRNFGILTVLLILASGSAMAAEVSVLELLGAASEDSLVFDVDEPRCQDQKCYWDEGTASCDPSTGWKCSVSLSDPTQCTQAKCADEESEKVPREKLIPGS